MSYGSTAAQYAAELAAASMAVENDPAMRARVDEHVNALVSIPSMLLRVEGARYLDGLQRIEVYGTCCILNKYEILSKGKYERDRDMASGELYDTALERRRFVERYIHDKLFPK